MKPLAITSIMVSVGIALSKEQGYLHYAVRNPVAAPPAFVDVNQHAGIVNNHATGIEMAAGQAWLSREDG